MYNWWLFIHVLGVVGFVLAHGVSTGMAFQIRNERSPERIRALLEMSASATLAFYASTFLLLLGGIAAGIDGHWFDQVWIGLALGVFVAEMVFMWVFTRPYYRRVRKVMTIEQAGGSAVGALEIEQVIASAVPIVSIWVGLLGLLFIVYLMAVKPF